VKELEDYNWFPPTLRNFQTEYIGYLVSRFHVHEVFIRHLNSLRLPMQTMHDLCSGSGEPAISIFHGCDCFDRLILSDKFPHPRAISDSRITYSSRSLDVRDMTFEAECTYTMFNAFHHFSDKEKYEIVNKISSCGSSAFFVEILQPRWDYVFKVLFASTVGVVLFSPFVQPFSFLRLFFTYVIPINVLLIAYDGILSVIKSRSVNQYNKLFARLSHKVKITRLSNNLMPLVLIQIEAEP